MCDGSIILAVESEELYFVYSFGNMATETSEFVENRAEYNDTYNIFTRGRREQEQLWAENTLVPKLVEILKHKESQTASEFKVMAVGSGIGSFDCMFLEVLFACGKELIEGRQITWTVVEPNESAIEKFKQDIASKSGIFEKVKFNWINKGVEEYLQVSECEKYDLVHFMHVLYYVNEEIVLKNAYEKCLKDNGCIFIAVGSKDDIWVNLIRSFKSKIPSLENELHYPTNIELSEICKRNGWAFETFDGKLDLEITEILEEGNPQGEAMLKFFLHIHEDPKKKFGEALVSELIEFFHKMSWEKIEGGKKQHFVNDNEGILLISK